MYFQRLFWSSQNSTQSLQNWKDTEWERKEEIFLILWIKKKKKEFHTMKALMRYMCKVEMENGVYKLEEKKIRSKCFVFTVTYIKDCMAFLEEGMHLIFILPFLSQFPVLNRSSYSYLHIRPTDILVCLFTLTSV